MAGSFVGVSKNDQYIESFEAYAVAYGLRDLVNHDATTTCMAFRMKCVAMSAAMTTLTLGK
jgi:hypothetical protein